MERTIHHYFDNYFFSIYRENDVFTIRIGTNSYPDDAAFSKLDGKIINFGKNRELWPHPKFLKDHNDRFFCKQMQANAEPKPIVRQDTDTTIIDSFDPIDCSSKVEKWILEQDVKQYEHINENTCELVD